MDVNMVKRVVTNAANVARPNWRDQSRRLVIVKELHNFKDVFRENFITLIVSAFGVVAALSWNDLVKALITEMFPANAFIIAKLYSAIAITLISIIITYLLSKLKPAK